MSQVVEAEIGEPCPLDRFQPRGIAKPPTNGLPAIGEAKAFVLTSFPCQYSDRLSIQRDASRRSILGAVQPCGLALQIDA